MELTNYKNTKGDYVEKTALIHLRERQNFRLNYVFWKQKRKYACVKIMVGKDCYIHKIGTLGRGCISRLLLAICCCMKCEKRPLQRSFIPFSVPMMTAVTTTQRKESTSRNNS